MPALAVAVLAGCDWLTTDDAADGLLTLSRVTMTTVLADADW